MKTDMRVNTSNLNDLIEDKFRGNITFFAETIGVDRGYLCQILKGTKKNSSPKVCNSVIAYCDAANLDYKDYIFFTIDCSNK